MQFVSNAKEETKLSMNVALKVVQMQKYELIVNIYNKNDNNDWKISPSDKIQKIVFPKEKKNKVKKD